MSTAQNPSGVASYELNWVANGLSWSRRADLGPRLAVASFVEEYNNGVQLLKYNPSTRSITSLASCEHCYPATKIQFMPPSSGAPDYFITTADYLRIWEVTTAADGATSISSKHCMNGSKNLEFCAPLTSCDWNTDDTKMVATSSIDTTVTLWDIEAQTTTTQLVAHDKDVFDVGFAKGTHVFASCGADGSLRVFDLRQLEHCTIVFETAGLKPLLRLAWNKLDPTYVATFSWEGNTTTIVDVRFPSIPVAELSNHTKPINCIGWAPHSARHLCSAGEDKQALIWDLNDLPNNTPKSCILTYEAGSEINYINWSANDVDLIAITHGKRVEILNV
jgi:WD repeat-containing protein 68